MSWPVTEGCSYLVCWNGWCLTAAAPATAQSTTVTTAGVPPPVDAPSNSATTAPVPPALAPTIASRVAAPIASVPAVTSTALSPAPAVSLPTLRSSATAPAPGLNGQWSPALKDSQTTLLTWLDLTWMSSHCKIQEPMVHRSVHFLMTGYSNDTVQWWMDRGSLRYQSYSLICLRNTCRRHCQTQFQG